MSYIKDVILLIAVPKEGRHVVKIASSLWVSIISFKIITELLAMTDDLINREMGRDGGEAAIPSHLSLAASPLSLRGGIPKFRESNLYDIKLFLLLKLRFFFQTIHNS